MKRMIKNIIPVALLTLGLASCSDNCWNNQLEGFDGDPRPTDVRTIAYTLTDADYGKIASNSTNKSLARQDSIAGNTDAIKALSAVGSQYYFTSVTPADKYVPAFLSDPSFPYYTLSDGSAINLTYREVGELPEVMQKLNGAYTYTVSAEDYQAAYGSSENYAESFSPSTPASASVPSILASKIQNPVEGDYVVVDYQESSIDPNFGGTKPEFELSDVLKADLVANQEVTVNGIVTATCTRGFILSDNAGSILAYSGSYEPGTYNVGDQLEVTAKLSGYRNCLQIPLDNATVKPAGQGAYSYPEPEYLSPDMLVAANSVTDPVLAKYGFMSGTVSVSGSYINLIFEDRSDVRGSIYYVNDAQKAELPDGAVVKVYGYMTQTSTSGDVINANFVVNNVENMANKPRRTRGVVILPSVTRSVAYVYNGSAWKTAGSDVDVIQADDYLEMGLTYGNFSGTQPAEYLPTYLSRKYPYAVKDKEVYVAYKYYANGKTLYACSLWSFTGSEWIDEIESNGVQEVTSQFVRRDGKWQFDPSIELTLPKGKGQPISTMFYQACVDWVLANVPDGDKYVTSYGNNDYYTGASAYQGNIDLRASAARLQYAAAYENMTDDEVVALMMKRFEDEVCPGVLKELYPDIAPLGDFHPTVTIHFFTYNGSSTDEQTIVYTVTAKATFELVSCTWNE